MGLILNREVNYSDIEIGGREEFDISNIYITVQKNFFSQTYEVIHYSYVTAEILDAYAEGSWFSTSSAGEIYLQEMKKEPLKLIFTRMKMSSDRLYFDNETWFKYRDFGILPGRTNIQIKITNAETTEGVVEVFPKRDVSA